MHKSQDMLSFLKANALFHGLSAEQITSLLPFLRTEIYKKGALIIQEEEKGEDLFLIQHGSVEVIKREEGGEVHHSLAKLHAGEWFGEMPLFDENSRSASVRALERTEVIRVPLKQLNALSKEDPSFSKVMMNLAKKMNSRLRNINEVAVKSLKEELQLTKAHDHMGQFIVHLFILLTFYFYMVKAFEQNAPDSLVKKMITSLLILSLGMSAALLVKKSAYSLEFYGLSLKNWRKNLYEGVLFTIPVLVFMFLFKWALISWVPAFKDLLVMQLGPAEHSYLYFFHSSVDRQGYFLLILLYILLVPVQEFLARGCLQGSLQHFFRSPHKIFTAILTSNLLFGMFHGLKTFSFVLCVFLLGIFWGWLYARQKTIVGPSISHALVGAWAFGFLDYQSLLIY